jgi:hypothetical protein
MASTCERKPAHAGSFYPGKKAELDSMLSALLSSSCKNRRGCDSKGKLKALIVPHAGYVYSAGTAAAGYSLLSQLAVQPKDFILLGPSHHALFEGLATCNFSTWATPLGSIASASIDKLCGKSELVVNACKAHAPEHCLEVQVPFLQKACSKDFCIYPALTCETDAKLAADYLAPALSRKGAFLIVSSDLSHFLSQQQAQKIDEASSRIITSLDLVSASSIDACGKTGIITAMILAKKFNWTCCLMDYSTSFAASGGGSRVVGYGCYAFFEKK